MAVPAANSGHYVEVNGASLYVEEHGAGVPMILTHGGLVSIRMWDDVVPLLAQHCRVITFDMRGHGKSTNPSGKFTYRIIADDVAELIESLGLKRPFVGGYSAGGEVTLEFGMRYADLARGLVAGGVNVDFQSPATQTALAEVLSVDQSGNIDFAALERNSPALVERLRRHHPRSQEQWRDIATRTWAFWREYPGFSQEQLAPITTPSLIALGDRDELVSLDEAIRLYHWLPNAELAILPGCDHRRAVTEPATFMAAMIDFIWRHEDDEL